jgi:iron-sulfur cluster assembly accessory protein
MPALQKPSIINVTDEAVKQARLLLSAKQDAYGIRVGVKSGGCSGLSYLIEYASTLGTFDEQVVVEDVKILIDKKAVLYLIGSTMDYVEEKFKSGFVFVNPKEKMKCGCGKSFSV